MLLLVFLAAFLFFHGTSDLTDQFNHIDLSSVASNSLRHTKSGTTIVGVCCRDGVVLGSDTRSTGGELIVDKNKLKMKQIAPQIFCCGAGTSADCAQVLKQTRFRLAKQRVERCLADEALNESPVGSAIIALADALNTNIIRSVFILGGMDKDGPALFQIAEDLMPQRLSIAALGSGAADALAVLEIERRKWRLSAQGGEMSDYIEDIDIETAIGAVRAAVRAGISNDLGSGSHVDVCVIKSGGCERWRESLISTWETDRLQRPASYSSSTHDGDTVPREVRQKLGLGRGKIIHRDNIFGTNSSPIDVEIIM